MIAALTLVVDQVTKALAVEKLQGRESIELIPNVLSLSFLRNGGAALGTGAGFTLVLSIVAVVVSIAVVRMAARLRDRGWAVGLGLLFAGASATCATGSSASPRRSKVMSSTSSTYHVFVGNVADIALTVAAVVILIGVTWRGVGLDGSRQVKS